MNEFEINPTPVFSSSRRIRTWTRFLHSSLFEQLNFGWAFYVENMYFSTDWSLTCCRWLNVGDNYRILVAEVYITFWFSGIEFQTSLNKPLYKFHRWKFASKLSKLLILLWYSCTPILIWTQNLVRIILRYNVYIIQILQQSWIWSFNSKSKRISTNRGCWPLAFPGNIDFLFKIIF